LSALAATTWGCPLTDLGFASSVPTELEVDITIRFKLRFSSLHRWGKGTGRDKDRRFPR